MGTLRMGLLALLFALVALPWLGSHGVGVPGWKSSQAFAEEGGSVAQVQLIMKKLRASMASMKDFDELEKAGMNKKDVDRMRRAMQQKIEKLTEEAVGLIRAL